MRPHFPHCLSFITFIMMYLFKEESAPNKPALLFVLLRKFNQVFHQAFLIQAFNLHDNALMENTRAINGDRPGFVLRCFAMESSGGQNKHLLLDSPKRIITQNVDALTQRYTRSNRFSSECAVCEECNRGTVI